MANIKGVLGWLTDRVDKLPLPKFVKKILIFGRKNELWDVKPGVPK